MKKLEKLSERQHKSLLDIGLLYEFYPKATGNPLFDLKPKKLTHKEKKKQRETLLFTDEDIKNAKF